MTTIRVLIDNRPSPTCPELFSEHGLSLWVDHSDKHILVDTGGSDRFLHNARLLGVEVSSADFVVLSHAHLDHTGGVSALASVIGEQPIYVAPHFFHPHFSFRHTGAKQDLSTSVEMFEGFNRLPTVVADSTYMSDSALIHCHSQLYAQPSANQFLTEVVDGIELPDRFVHEESLCLSTERGLVIISPCSHCGVGNIIRSCKEFMNESRVAAFVGGFHLPDGEGVEHEAAALAEAIMIEAPDAEVFTGHCTGSRAFALLAERLPKVHLFHTGMCIAIC